ncbi:MAG TPA: hypothetical protein VI136_26825 [Verrucomicrobiae bacterium]
MNNETTAPAVPRAAILAVLLFAVTVGVLWAFPAYWYRGAAKDAQFLWLSEQTNVAGWTFKDIPIGEAAEAVLVGDRSVNGEFSSGDAARVIRVFSIKRYLQKENEIGLFSHTPDRCWTGAGWKIELIKPESLECQIHGLAVRFERRLFVHEEMKELVYFGAIAGGKALPYRLDQYLTASLERTEKAKRDQETTLFRLRSGRMWGWTWDSFVHRTAFGGPQQFIRISTPVGGSVGFLRSAAPTHDELRQADKRLQDFLPRWLLPVDYTQEYNEWKASKIQAAQGTTTSPPKVH